MEKWKVVKRDLRATWKGAGTTAFLSKDGAIELHEIFAQQQHTFSVPIHSLVLLLSGSMTDSQNVIYQSGDCFFTKDADQYKCESDLCRLIAISFPNAFERFSLPEMYLNELSVLIEKDARISLGLFEGRTDGQQMVNSENVAVMVLQGAFEVNERLLETSDAIFGSHINEISFESLSNNALLLIAEY